VVRSNDRKATRLRSSRSTAPALPPRARPRSVARQFSEAGHRRRPVATSRWPATGVAGASISGSHRQRHDVHSHRERGTGYGTLGLNLSDNDRSSTSTAAGRSEDRAPATGNFTGQVYTIDTHRAKVVSINRASTDTNTDAKRKFPSPSKAGDRRQHRRLRARGKRHLGRGPQERHRKRHGSTP